MCIAKSWRARCETNVNQLQEYKSGGTKHLRNHGIHVAETLLRLCRKLTRHGHLQLRCTSGSIGMCVAKSWHARCETNVNQLQEFKSGGAKSFQNHGIHVAGTWLSICRKLTRGGRYNCDVRAGASACAMRKPWRLHCETTANQLQEYTSCAARAFQIHGKHVAKLLQCSCKRREILLNKPRLLQGGFFA
jgi:hypothetical protein